MTVIVMIPYEVNPKMTDTGSSRFSMNRLMLGILLSVALVGCSDKDNAGGSSSDKPVARNAAAGKTFAERECKGCHGLDGKGVAPGIPHLAGQSDRYLLTSLKEYKDRKRTHAALREIAAHMSETDARNVASYYSEPAAHPAGHGQGCGGLFSL